MQLLVGLMGMVGRFLAMVIMMLQLTSCAGTFPAELLPRFFQVLNPYFPMTYGTAGLRRIITGSSTVGLGTCLTVLATFLAGALALTMLTESRFVSIRDLHPSQELAA